MASRRATCRLLSKQRHETGNRFHMRLLLHIDAPRVERLSLSRMQMLSIFDSWCDQLSHFNVFWHGSPAASLQPSCDRQ